MDLGKSGLMAVWLGLAGLAAGMSLEEAGKALASDEFEVREQGDAVIRRASLADYDKVAKLVRSKDPEVAGRANAALPIIRMDIDPQLPNGLAERLFNFDRLERPERIELARAVASMPGPRLTTIISLHSYWLEHPEMNRQDENNEIFSLDQVLDKRLQGEQALATLAKLDPARYHQETLAKVLNLTVKQTPGDLAPMLPLYVRWTKVYPKLTDYLNADGFRLEIVQQVSTAKDANEQLLRILKLGANLLDSRDRMAAVRRQLSEYREVAEKFPVETLDQNLGWFFFDTVGNQNGLAFLDAYCKFRARFPDIHDSALLNQPLEGLRILKEEGPRAGMEFGLNCGRNDAIGMIADWFREHPEEITEPLPLPDIAKGAEFSYRPIKFIRVFAPYTEAELAEHPKIAAAIKILKQDSKWVEAFRQAQPRILEDRKAAEARKQKAGQ